MRGGNGSAQCWSSAYGLFANRFKGRRLRQALVDAALLVTMADTLGDALKRRIKDAQRHHKIEVLHGEELFARLLTLIADQNIAF